MTDHRTSRRTVLGLLGAVPLVAAGAVPATAGARRGATLDDRIQEIIGRPDFAGARWGMKFWSLDRRELVYAMSPDQLFQAGSAYKVFIAGTAFSTLRPDYRFRTRVYGTGPVVRGVLKGDLVLVASGDLLLGGRIQPDGSLALPDPDHTYARADGVGPLPGDPIRTLRQLACQVARRGVRRIDGSVLVDASLFREGHEPIATGVTIPISPMMVNDNVVDVSVSPGSAAGAPGVLRVSPRTAYVHIVNDVVTIPAGTAGRQLRLTDDVRNPDGTRSVKLTGDVPLGDDGFLAYHVPEPVRFAEITFAEALRDEGVRIQGSAPGKAGTARHKLAEHMSPPLSEQVKPMLKVSSNPHAAYFPYLIGTIAGQEKDDPKAAYDTFQRRLYEQAGLDADPAGAAENRYTPDFFVQFLDNVARQPYRTVFRAALPIMGRDGTIGGVQVDSPAAGHVYAKTGSAGGGTDPNIRSIGKALAGYIKLPAGRTVVFAEFTEIPVQSPGGAPALLALAHQALGEIVTAVYEELA